MIWAAVAYATIEAAHEHYWEKSYAAASPEQRKEMLREREERRKEAEVERRHQETLRAIRDSERHLRSSNHESFRPHQPDNFLTGFLLGKLF